MLSDNGNLVTDILQQHLNSEGIYKLNKEPRHESAWMSGDIALLTSALYGEWPIHASAALLQERILKEAEWPAEPVRTGWRQKITAMT
jgi:hypothetical protein